MSFGLLSPDQPTDVQNCQDEANDRSRNQYMADSYELQRLVPIETQCWLGLVISGSNKWRLQASGIGGFRGSADVLRTWSPCLSGFSELASFSDPYGARRVLTTDLCSEPGTR